MHLQSTLINPTYSVPNLAVYRITYIKPFLLGNSIIWVILLYLPISTHISGAARICIKGGGKPLSVIIDEEKQKL